MKSKWIAVALLLAAPLVAGTAYAVEGLMDRTNPPKNKSGLRAAQDQHERLMKREQKRKAAAAIKPVDINNASRDELKTLPGMGDAEATRIIAGRPYGSKAWLVTHHVINGGTYEAIKRKIVAGRPASGAAPASTVKQ